MARVAVAHGALFALITLVAAALPAAPQPRAAPEPLDQKLERAREAGRQRLRDLVARGDSPGMAAAVAIDGRLVWAEGFGHANLEHGVRATGQTRFGLGSLSKTITVIGLLSLMDRGLIDIDAPVERYLPDFPHARQGVTLRRLAAHQSGLSDRFAIEHNWTGEHFENLESAYQRLRHDPLATRPGTTVHYATGTYTVIGRAMERATGRTFAEIIQRDVVEPAGVTSITPNDRRAIVADRTAFYAVRPGGGFEHGPYFDPSFKLPGAGFVGSAADVARLGAALLEGRLIGTAARSEMFRPVALSDGTPTEYALGLRVGEHHGRPMYHLPGGGIGISTWIHLYPAERLAMAVLSNVATGSVGGRTHEVIATAFLEAVGR
jgi:CubicO group peptidase (beta-lactamase class C family)